MRTLLSRAGLVLASTTLALGLAEVALRVAAPDEREGGGAVLLQPIDHPDLDYVYAPGASRGSRVPVQINSRGFRDREYSPSKPPGTRRIVVIGDSVAFGLGVAVEDTFPKQLEALLAGSAPPTQVLNLGVGGYDVVNEVAFLEEFGLRFEPDLVVLAFCINDAGIHSANARTLRWLQSYGWLADRSALARFALRRLDRTELTRDLHLLNEDAEFRRRNEGRIDSLADDPEQQARMAELAASLGSPRRLPSPAGTPARTRSAACATPSPVSRACPGITASRPGWPSSPISTRGPTPTSTGAPTRSQATRHAASASASSPSATPSPRREWRTSAAAPAGPKTHSTRTGQATA